MSIYGRMTLAEKIELVKDLIVEGEKQNNKKGVEGLNCVLETLERDVERVKRTNERLKKFAKSIDK